MEVEPAEGDREDPGGHAGLDALGDQVELGRERSLVPAGRGGRRGVVVIGAGCGGRQLAHP